MTKTRFFAALAATLLCAALLTGCGGPTKEEYEKDVSKLGESVNEDLDQLDSGTPTEDDLSSAQDTLEEAADGLEDIEAPSEVEGLHDDLIKTLRDTAKLFDRMAPLMEKAADDPTSLGEDELAAMNEITDDFGDIEKRMAKVEKGFEDKDYDIGLGDDSGDDKE